MVKPRASSPSPDPGRQRPVMASSAVRPSSISSLGPWWLGSLMFLAHDTIEFHPLDSPCLPPICNKKVLCLRVTAMGLQEKSSSLSLKLLTLGSKWFHTLGYLRSSRFYMFDLHIKSEASLSVRKLVQLFEAMSQLSIITELNMLVPAPATDDVMMSLFKMRLSTADKMFNASAYEEPSYLFSVQFVNMSKLSSVLRFAVPSLFEPATMI